MTLRVYLYSWEEDDMIHILYPPTGVEYIDISHFDCIRKLMGDLHKKFEIEEERNKFLSLYFKKCKSYYNQNKKVDSLEVILRLGEVRVPIEEKIYKLKLSI